MFEAQARDVDLADGGGGDDVVAASGCLLSAGLEMGGRHNLHTGVRKQTKNKQTYKHINKQPASTRSHTRIADQSRS